MTLDPQILPARVYPIDQRLLLTPSIALNLLFAGDSFCDGGEGLVVYAVLQSVVAGGLDNQYELFNYLFVSCSPQRTDYYLPKGFTGDVAIFYDCKDGQDVQIKDGRRQIVIPDSGVVLLKSPFKDGGQEERFYQMSASGSPIEITHFHSGSDTSGGASHIYFERLAEIDGMAPPNKIYETDVLIFYVGTDPESETNSLGFENRVKEIVAKN
jgi:hypothetical protein